MELMQLLDEMRKRAPEQGWTLAGSRSPQWLRSLALDSREVGPGDLFFCVPGLLHDGHDHAEEAVAQGAAAVVVERPLGLTVPEIRVSSVRQAMAALAAAFHGDPSHSMQLVGVTGTNGKTTTTQFLHHIFETCGTNAATIGTLSGARTTPEAIHLQEQLAKLHTKGTQAVAIEVSSHALTQHRVDATRFSVGVFTNLSQDHLDYHRTMDEYFEAKAKLFVSERIGTAVINADDPYGQRLLDRVGDGVDVRTYSRSQAVDLQPSLRGSTFVWRGATVTLPIAGLFNVDNALAAAETALALGFGVEPIAQALATLPSVAGRFERVDGEPTVVVDYAHTPDGLEQLLRSVREIAPTDKIVLVFGAGGDRDRAKRSMMGQVAEQHADHVIVTSDNPRGEDPQAIIDDIVAGMANPPAHTEVDRRSAIASAIDQAVAYGSNQSVVLVAGKGHETTQTIGEQVLPFDDRLVAAEILEAIT